MHLIEPLLPSAKPSRRPREVSLEEAVAAYHGVLQKLGVKPHRSLDDDMLRHRRCHGGDCARMAPPRPVS